ncbi:MAG: hypothetical protein JO224_00890 [Pelomonas sp.]|nr:hypothetical protein [Roseateles sp.]
MNDDDISRLVRAHASRYPADERLRAAVRTQTALQSAARKPARTRPSLVAWLAGLGASLSRVPRLQRVSPAGRLGGLFGGVAAGLVLGVALTLGVQSWRAGPATLGDELVAGHVRALQVGPLFEVASSDHHTVRPWFQGRLDYAPPVFDKLPGYTLLGGRVESLRGTPTAVLAYQVKLHKIDVYVWPDARVAAPELLHRRGFNIVHWSDGAMQCWAVSDAEGGELARLAAAWQAAQALQNAPPVVPATSIPSS